MKTFGELKLECGRMVNKTDSNTLTRLGEAINRKYHEVMLVYNGDADIRTLPVTVDAGTGTVGVHYEARAIKHVYNETIKSPVKILKPHEMDMQFGELRESGMAIRHCAVEGHRGVYKDLPTSAALKASAGAGDTCNVQVSGYDPAYGTASPPFIDALPFIRSATVVGNGGTTLSPTTALASGARIQTFTKDCDTSEAVKLFITVLTVDIPLGYIGPMERSASYAWLRFSGLADQDTTLRVVAKIRLPDLVSDLDTMVVDEVEQVVLVGAVADFYRSLREFSKASVEERRYQFLKEEFLFRQEADSGAAFQASGAMHEYRDPEPGWR